MPVTDEYLDYICDQLSLWGEIRVRKMFGGAGLYCEGLMFALVADNELYFKVDDSNRIDYERSGSSAFKPYADKPTRMSYYRVPDDVLENPEELAGWADKALAVQRGK